jgi:hypothetical protein
MAEHTIFQFTLITNRGSGYNAGSIVECKWDDVASTVNVYLASDFFDTSPSLQTSGPHLGSLGTDVTYPIQTGYKFCSGTTLNYFLYNVTTYPYAIQQQQFDSIGCAVIVVPVCDLVISNDPVITTATNLTSADGSFTISATSSNGTIKAAINDFNYSTQGNLLTLGSYTFSAMYGGTYTVYVKDSYGCVATKTITVPILSQSGVRYISEWKDLQGRDHKVEILEKDYSGSVEHITASGSPATYKLNAEGEDRFYVIRASEFRFRAHVGTDFQYINLYTEDERKFQLKHYIDTVFEWAGFLIPYLYNEPYTQTPYEIEIVATDGLANLKDLDFVDASDNLYYLGGTQLSFIASILLKLGQGLNIRIACNLYEDSMLSTNSDDPIAQAVISPSLYNSEDGTPSKCDEVIKNILNEYTAVICQCDGVWMIYRPEETISYFDYREYNSNGQYVTNGSINPIVDLIAPTSTNGIYWVNQSGSLSVIPSYGKFIVKQILNKRKSLLSSYGFELKDVVPFDGNTYFFSGWNISINSGSAITWGIEDVIRGDSKGAMYIRLLPPNLLSDSRYKEVITYTVTNPIQFKAGGTIKFSFDYLIALAYQYPWAEISYKLKVGGYFLSPDKVFSTIDGFNKIYPQTYNQWQTYSKSINCPLVTSDTDGFVELYLKITNNAINTALDTAALKAEATTGTSTLGNRNIVSIPTALKGYYELEIGTDAESLPDVVRPNDYAAVSNEKVWKLKFKTNGQINIEKVLLDNVIVDYMPDGVVTPEFQESSIVTNPNNKRTLTIEIKHGDVPTGITNAANAYDSYLSYGGAPTTSWTRDGVSEATKIQNILLKSNIAQSQKASRRLQGSLRGDIKLRPYSCINETMDSNRKYQMQAFEIEYKESTYTVDLYEIKNVLSAGTDGNTSAFSSAFAPQAFGSNFD